MQNKYGAMEIQFSNMDYQFKNMKNKIKNIIETYLLGNNIPSNKTIVSIDIQPEYKNFISFNIFEFGNYINECYKNNNRIIFLYNGADTLGMISENEYKNWLYENVGIEDDVLDNILFYDKGYAFFRYCIDNQIEVDDIVYLVKYMYENNINDSRDIDWEQLINDNNNNNIDYSNVKELLEYADDCITIPDLMDFLNNHNNMVLMGGSLKECFKEVEIALQVLDKNYTIENKFIF